VQVLIRAESDSHVGAAEQSDPLAARILDAAVEATPAPADLPDTPLDRLNAGQGDTR